MSSHRSMQLLEIGAPLRSATLDLAPPGPAEVRIAIRACGLNFGDLLVIDGRYQESRDLPFVPGMEVAGIVEAVGEGVDALKVGQRVAAFSGFGGLAEAALVPAAVCVSIPDAMDDVTAAAFLVAYGTSHVALERRARLKAGERLVVLGAAGGVGLTAVEIGKLMGAEVVAVARGKERLAVAKAAGADHLVDSDVDDLRNAVKDLGGADVVYDPVGGALFKAALRACNPEARILPLGFASGEVPQIPANILLVKNIEVLGFYWGAYARFAPHVLTESFAKLFRWFELGKLKPHVSHVLPLDRANEGLDLLRTRKATGKVVIET